MRCLEGSYVHHHFLVKTESEERYYGNGIDNVKPQLIFLNIGTLAFVVAKIEVNRSPYGKDRNPS